MSQSEEPEVEEQTQPQLEADEGTYRFIGEHAISLESGQPVAPGEYVTFENKGEANKNKHHFEEGDMLPAHEYAPQSDPKPKEKGGS